MQCLLMERMCALDLKMLNLKKFCTRKNISIVAVIFIFCVGFLIYWTNYLKIAHSSFENYYNFRGCVKLIEKNDAYGKCELASGQIIKLVKFQNKWYLDGDLPYPGLNFL